MSTLTATQLHEFKRCLKARREKLRKEVHQELMREEQHSYAELAGRVRDTGDNSIADLFSDLNIAAVNRQLEEMEEIEPALHRIDNGTYGTCIDCGSDIDLARLEVYPTAERCITCQTRYEETHVGKETPSL